MNRPVAHGPATTASLTDSHSLPCIFPRRRPAEPSEFLRMRRARLEYVAAVGDSGSSLTPPPATFGLSDDDLRAHANQLYRMGWRVEEIRAVLAVEPVTS